MQVGTACPTISQCRGVGIAAALPSLRASQVTMPRGVVAASGGQALLPSCSNSSFQHRIRAADTQPSSDHSNAATSSSRFVTTSGGAAVGLGGGYRRKQKIEKVSGCRAAVHESSFSTVVKDSTTENGSSRLTEISSPDLLHHHSSDFIGFGCVLEGGPIFRERFVIRFSEAGCRGTISLETLSSLLQEAATNHVVTMDYAYMPGKNLDGIITVITRMHIEVDRYPAWRDLLEIDTWFQREGKNAVRRDWTVKDVRTGQTIVFATSTWVLMNTITKRMSKLTEERWADLDPHMRNPPRYALSEDRREVSTTKIVKLGDGATYKKFGLVASDKDTDMNQHVNNIRYMGWMLESIPEEVKSTHEVSKITLEYRQEATQGDPVESVAEAEESENSTVQQFIHLIKTSESGKEINRGRTVWRPLQ